MRGDDVGVVPAVGLQRHHQVEIALVGVWLALLSHVVARGLGEVEAPYRDLAHVILLEVHAIRTERIF